MSPLLNVAVFCASSSRCDPAYLDAAGELGGVLAREKLAIFYGGGRVGAMGRLADGALEAGGRVIGVIPRFMVAQGWQHEGCSELRVVDGMGERIRLFLEADAFIALPGGSGTLDELFQALSWKRLGLVTGPILILNLNRYFDPCLQMLGRCIQQRFMDPRHEKMWTVVDSVEKVPAALRAAPPWDPSAIDFAAI